MPFYPSVYIGRIASHASNSFGNIYQFDDIAKFGIITILLFMVASIVLSIISFKHNMTSDK